MTRLQGRIVLGAVVLLALGLRLYGIQYGLPSVYNPDEVAIMARALSFAKGTLNPHNFLYPTFYFYVLFAWVGAYLGFVWLTGGVASVAALQQLYFTDPTGIYTAGRVLGCGTRDVVCTGRVRAGQAPLRHSCGSCRRCIRRRSAACRPRFTLREARHPGHARGHRRVHRDHANLAG